MFKIHFAIFFTVLLVSCATTQVNTDNANEKDVWTVEADNRYTSEEPVKMVLTNNADQFLVIMDPLSQNVERNVNGTWERVGILYCDCGGCPPPPETREVRVGDTFTFSWDQQEEKCISGKLDRRPAGPGKYRVVFRYYSNPREVQKLFVSFELK